MDEFYNNVEIINSRDERYFGFLTKENYRGSYASIYIEPTVKEINYVLDQLEKMNQNEKDFKSRNDLVDSYSYIEAQCVCSDFDFVGFVIASFDVSEITDVPEDDWDDDRRIINVSYCEKCLRWFIYE